MAKNHIPVAENRKIRRGRGAGAEYRFRQLGGGSCGGISGRRRRIWSGLQDFHHRRSGNPLWNLQQLGAGGDLLDWRQYGVDSDVKY